MFQWLLGSPSLSSATIPVRSLPSLPVKAPLWATGTLKKAASAGFSQLSGRMRSLCESQ